MCTFADAIGRALIPKKDRDEGSSVTSPASGPTPRTVQRSGDYSDMSYMARPDRASPASPLGGQPKNDLAPLLGSEGCRQILRLLVVEPGLNLDSTSLTRLLGLDQSTVSRHLNDLARAGLLTKQRSGPFMVYRASSDLQATLEAAIKVPASDGRLPIELLLVLRGHHPNRGVRVRTEQQREVPAVGLARAVGPTDVAEHPTVREGGNVDDDRLDQDDG